MNNFSFPAKNYYDLIGLPTDPVSYKRLSENFIKKYRQRFRLCKLHKNIPKIISLFSNFGIDQSILSAAHQSDLQKFISFYGLNKYFKIISGVTDTKANGKLNIAQNHLNQIKFSKNEILFIGDTLHDNEVAKRMGIPIVLVSFGHNSYPILKKSGSPIVQTPSELLNFVRS